MKSWMSMVREGWTRPVPDARLTRWLFLRALAVVTFLGFLSLNRQLLGLIGQEGILPIAQALGNASVGNLWEGFWQFPTLVWWFSSDTALLAISWAGMAVSVLLLLDVFPRGSLLVLWFLYLSLFLAGRLFTSYQWDLLLTEVLFASVFFAPATLLPGAARKGPTKCSRFLLTLILFKLMFLGGLVKLLGGDPTWWNLTALDYHFWTQPLPNPLAWWVDKLPSLLLSAGVVLTLVVELIVPFFLFLGRRWKTGAGLAVVVFQAVVAATGNYGIFNLLSAVLCLVVLDDSVLEKWVSPYRTVSWEFDFMPSVPERGRSVWAKGFEGLFVVALVVLNLFVFLQSVGIPVNYEPVRSIRSVTSPFRTVNSYGLFANMTTKRREIIVQGSKDGSNWRSYRFPYKPDDPNQAPPVVAPHMPRLDWQMWFAALKPPDRVRWFPNFLKRLLEGSEPVLGLLAHNPFPEGPPRYVRAIVYDYTFTDWETGWKEGRLWKRSNRRIYFPSVTLRNGQLRRVNPTR